METDRTIPLPILSAKHHRHAGGENCRAGCICIYCPAPPFTFVSRSRGTVTSIHLLLQPNLLPTHSFYEEELIFNSIRNSYCRPPSGSLRSFIAFHSHLCPVVPAFFSPPLRGASILPTQASLFQFALSNSTTSPIVTSTFSQSRSVHIHLPGISPSRITFPITWALHFWNQYTSHRADGIV